MEGSEITHSSTNGDEDLYNEELLLLKDRCTPTRVRTSALRSPQNWKKAPASRRFDTPSYGFNATSW